MHWTSAAAAGLATATAAGPNSAACRASRSGWPPPAASATTRNRSGLRRMMSSAWVPIEPVEPRITTSRWLGRGFHRTIVRYPQRMAAPPP